MIRRAIVVGLGGIGMQTDLALDPELYVYSHCRALAQHPEFELVGAVDPNSTQRGEFEDHYHSPAFGDVASALAALRPDIVVIAVPTASHGDVLRQVLASHRPSAILCEKPLSFDLAEARELVDLCQTSGVRLYVNYIRHSDPGVGEVGRRIVDGRIETPLKGIAWYSKGLFNNGSHLVELLSLWLGPIQGFQLVDSGRVWNGSDPEPDVVIAFQKGRIHLMAAWEEAFSHYGIEMVSPSGRLRYDDGGAHLTWQAAVENPSFPSYRMLDPVGENVPVGLNRIQWHVVDQLQADLEGGVSAICSGPQALDILEKLAAIRDAL